MNDLRHEMHERFSAQDEVLAAHGDEVMLRKRPYDLAGMLAQVEPCNRNRGESLAELGL